MCFIGGLGRSGSTLLERVIGELPDVVCLGEVVHLWSRGIAWDEQCGCGEAFSRCPFWQAVGERAFGGWSNVDVARVQRLRAEVDRIRVIPLAATARAGSKRLASMREYADYYQRVYAAAKQVSGAHVVVDSSKNASTAFVLRSCEQIALRVLHVVRDSRGVAYSWTKEIVRPEADRTSVKRLMHQYSPGRAALLWNAHNLAFGALGHAGVPTLRVRYERLVSEPVRVVTDIARFLGLDATSVDQFARDDSVTLSRSHLVAGNPMRFQTGELRLRQDDAWRVRLDPRSRRTVSVLTAPLLLRYGYLRRDAR